MYMSERKEHVKGTFSFTLATEWDYVSRKKRKEYLQSSYSLPIHERLNMEKAVKMLLDAGWVPYDPVTADSVKGHFAAESSDKTPAYNEYLYFNSHMRRLIYNQEKYDAKADSNEAYARAVAARNDGVVVFRKYETGAHYVLKRKMPGNVSGCKILEQCLNEYGYTFLHKYAHRNNEAEGEAEASADALKKWVKQQIEHGEKFKTNRLMTGSELEWYRTYTLPVNAIELRLYPVGILLLTIKCQCEQQWTKSAKTCYYFKEEIRFDVNKMATVEIIGAVGMEDISWIESCGRRLFAARPMGNDQGGNNSFFSEFPVESYIQIKDGRIPICSFSEKNATVPEQLDFLEQLVCDSCMTYQKYEKQDMEEKDCLVLDCFNDDRMYLHGTVVSQELVDRTRKGWKERHADAEPYQLASYLSLKKSMPGLECEAKNEQELEEMLENAAEKVETGWQDLRPWYGILYGDPDWNNPTCTDKDMLVQLVEEATDARWMWSGTITGMTYHSMLMLLTPDAPAYLYSNNDWIYFQMFIIAVLQRCTIQRFYREASGLLQTHTVKDGHRAAVQDKYTLFLNQFWFYEVTEQEQGKMMFARLQKAMKINEDVEFLDRALEEVNQQAENRTATNVNKLLLPLSVVGGIWTVKEAAELLMQNDRKFTLNIGKLISDCSWSAAGQYICNGLLQDLLLLLCCLIIVGVGVCFVVYCRNQFRHIKWLAVKERKERSEQRTYKKKRLL